MDVDALVVDVSRIFLPDIRAAGDWTSSIVIRNNSIYYTGFVKTTFFLPDPVGNASQTNEIPPRGTIAITPLLYGATVVEAGQDMSVVVENLHSNGGSLNSVTNYTGIMLAGQGANPDWGQAGSPIYAPTVKYNYGSRTTSLYIMNVGSTSTSVTINYYDDNGNPVNPSATCTNLAANAQCIKTPTAGTIMSAKITAGQPLAIVAVEYNSDQSQVSTHNLLKGGATTLFAPVIKKDSPASLPQNTGLRIRNVGSSATDVTVYYYGSSNHTSAPQTIQPGGAYNFYKDPVLPVNNYLGSAKIVSTGGQLIVGQVHEAGTYRKMSSSVSQQGSTSVYAPRVCNPCTIGGVSFTAGVRVQNVGTGAANITITYYHSDGTWAGSETISNLGANYAQNVAAIPANLNGSAVITADKPIVVVVNLANSNTNQDLTMTYNAPNR